MIAVAGGPCNRQGNEKRRHERGEKAAMHWQHYPQVPQDVEYSLTAYRRTLAAILEAMAAYRVKHQRRMGTYS
jgi:DNA-binding HxlR family transcriptional regulator